MSSVSFGGAYVDGTVSFGSGSGTITDCYLGTGLGAGFIVTNNISFVWAGGSIPYYCSHGDKTFNVDPAGGAAGFWIGETNLPDIVRSLVTPKQVDVGMTDWQLDPSTYNGYDIEIVPDGSVVDPGMQQWQLFAGGDIIGSNLCASNDTVMVFEPSMHWSGTTNLVATRRKVSGYVLCSHDDKPLARASDISGIVSDVNTVSNMVLNTMSSVAAVSNMVLNAVSLDAIAPLFISGNSYTNGDFVIYNTHMYECTNAQSGAWVQGNWKQTSVAEILGNLRSILDEINGEAL